MTYVVTDPEQVARVYDRASEKYDETFLGNPGSVARFCHFEQIFAEWSRGATRLLDLGCGTARGTTFYDVPHVVGVDVSQGMLRRAVARQIRVARADAHQLPFLDQGFDAVVVENAVVPHLRIQTALAEIFRVLRPGGILAVQHYAGRTWSPRRFWQGVQERPYHLKNPDQFLRSAQDAGLDTIAAYYWRSIPVFPYLVRLLPPPWAWHLWSHAVFVFRRPGKPFDAFSGPAEWACPVCRIGLLPSGPEGALFCPTCERTYPIARQIPQLLVVNRQSSIGSR